MFCTFCCSLNFSSLQNWIPARIDALPTSTTYHENYLYFFHHHSKDKLRQSMKEGCHFCTLLWNGLAASRDVPHQKCAAEAFRNLPTAPVVLATFCSKNTQVGPWKGSLPLNVKAWCDDCQFEFSLRSLSSEFGIISDQLSGALENKEQVDHSTGSSQTMDVARIWLERCIKSHPLCNRSTPSYLPTRVIDVENLDAGTGPVLYSSRSMESASYVALSHCWGPNGLSIKTETVPSSQRLVLPQIDCWPKTFRDAVHVIRCLRIRYLWIDALCIAQKDENDWAIEAERMADYYGNSTITIAAVRAGDGEAGCFVNRNTFLARPCRLDWHCSEQDASNLDEGAVFACYSPYGKSLRDPQETRLLPLYQRGWTFQEELLSPRLLKFANRQIYWECIYDHSSELNPDGNGQSYVDKIPSSLLHHGYVLKLPSAEILNASYLKSVTTPKRYFYTCWYAYVRKFTQRELSFQTDMLPAMSGVARKLCDLMTGVEADYVAGLWKDDLVVGLLWSVECVYPVNEVEHYIAPTWSWASQPGAEINWSLCEARIKDITPELFQWGDPVQRVEILDAQCHPYITSTKGASHTFGQTSEGHLKLKGPLIPMLMHSNNERGDLFRDYYPAMSLNKEHIWPSILNRTPGISILDSPKDIQRSGEPELRVTHFLPLLKRSADTLTGFQVISGLVLDNLCCHGYKRVGIASFRKYAVCSAGTLLQFQDIRVV